MKITQILKDAATVLHAAGVAEARREAKSLLAFALDKNQAFLIAHSEDYLSVEEENRFQSFVKRRADREPFQYIVGRQEFYGLDFAVTKDVLIPRPETGMIVEAAVALLQNEEKSSFCEVGIGSGCIAVSILHSVKTARAVGLDISAAALKIAARNAVAHRVAERLELKISDVFDGLENRSFDLLVSNPPYIPSADIADLQTEVSGYEPLEALTDGGGGLSIIEKIIKTAPRFLKTDGFLLMEIGINQADTVKALFDKKIWAEVEILPDWQNIPRMVKAGR